MYSDLLFIDLFGIFVFSMASLSIILSMFGFIGNININSGDGNVNVSGVDAEYAEVDEVEETLETGNAVGISIKNLSGKVFVNPGDDKNLILRKKLFLPKATPDNEKQNIQETFKNAFLAKVEDKINLEVPKMIVLGAMSARVDLELTVPRSFSVKILPGTNEIALSDLDGKIEVTNSAGNIKLNKLSGELIVQANSGTISGNELLNPVMLSLNAGNISCSGLSIQSHEAIMQVGAGTLEVDIDKVASHASCRIGVNAGDVLLSLNREAQVTLDVKSNMGTAILDPEIKVISGGKTFMGYAVIAEVNNGGGKVDVSSNTGKIKVILK